mmetsp:Transcript_25172/g.41417  ORF Transcript_25172/g.41417 Transcript_25172/m.41417 type:complete len:252 (-) Transcript_25172:50-805(-)
MNSTNSPPNLQSLGLSFKSLPNLSPSDTISAGDRSGDITNRDNQHSALMESQGSLVIAHQFLQISLLLEELDDSGSTKPIFAKKEPQFSKSVADSRFKHDWTLKLKQNRRYRFIAKIKNAHPLARFTFLQVNNQVLADFKRFSTDNNAMMRMEGVWATTPDTCGLSIKGERTYIEVKLGYSLMEVDQLPISFKLQTKVYSSKVDVKRLWGTSFDHATILADTRSGMQDAVEIFYSPGGGIRPRGMLAYVGL